MTITSKVNEPQWTPFLKQFPLWSPPTIKTIVLSPHPDDETLGAGGLINDLVQSGIDVSVITITNGENAYPYVGDLGQLRQTEQKQALATLGVKSDQIFYLGLKDSGCHKLEETLYTLLLPFMNKSVHVIAPWINDFHPDHKMVGKVATKIASQYNIALTYYFFWTWHQADITDLQPLNLKIYPLHSLTRAKKQSAIECYPSQLNYPPNDPILRKDLLTPAYRSYEVFLPYEY